MKSMNLKTRTLITATLAFVTAFTFAAPAMANTFNYSWTMNFRSVNGKDNGVFYSMTTGQGYLSGNLSTNSKDIPNPPGPFLVHFEVRRNSLFVDPLICERTVQPNSTGSASFSLSSCGGQWSSGNYYIVVYKVEDDGWNMSGTGTIKTA
jgi:hypothetical protein